MKKKPEIIQTRQAGDDHQVVTVAGGAWTYRKKPCSDCPWRKDAVGEFPAEAFVLSASTAYDMSQHTFACHQNGSGKPATCAGFLLRGADHNLTVRLKMITGEYRGDADPAGHDLHSSYKAMAIANGVPATNPALTKCRAPGYNEE